jgi:hypothetical protein
MVKKINIMNQDISTEKPVKPEKPDKSVKPEKPEKPVKAVKAEKPVSLKKERKIKNINSLPIAAETNILSNDENISEIDNILEIDKNIPTEQSFTEDEIGKTTVAKKRGRKPKGGKIVFQMLPKITSNETKPNIILHLKCSLKDIQNNLFYNNEVESYHFSSGKNDLNYEIIMKENDIISDNFLTGEVENNTLTSYDDESISELNNNSLQKNNDLKQVWKKLKQLEYSLHVNNICDKKSACFWCTYDFDNPPIYIPKHYIKDSYHVYGCFCSPECATAYLMEENIDSSAKFERYQLLNNIYSKIYDYNVNIKPSPNPYYMLEKFYGNLSIQEYRSLLKNERLFLIVDKPLTRILPELHEDNDDFIINNKIIPSSNLLLKGKLRKKTTGKNNLVNEKFGLS